MADCTVSLRMNILLFLQPLAQRKLVFANVFGLPVKFRYKLNRAKVWLWIAMAVNTPCHRLIFVLMDDFHLVDPSVTSHTRNTAGNVGGVIEIHVVGQPVDTNPIDRLTRPPAFMDRLQLRTG